MIMIAMITLTLLTVAVVMAGLKKALMLSSFSPQKQIKIFRITVLTVIGWLLFTALLAGSDFLSDFSTLPPRLFLVVLPPLVVIIFLTFTKNVKELLQVIPPSWLVYIQHFRLYVELILWGLFLTRQLPVQMTFEGLNWDILVGLTALPAGYLWFRKKKFSLLGGIMWNVFGLGLLANIVTIAILSMPLPIQVYMEEPANRIVATFPMVWLPAVLVPIAYGMHFFSLRQLWIMRREQLS